MKINTYNTLTYEEDEIKANPAAFTQGEIGKRKCQHVTISDKAQISEFLSKCGLESIADEMVTLSILWHFPRRQYNETDMWVCMSGYTYNRKFFKPKTFVISDNIVTEESQKLAKELIDMLNGWDGLEVSYPNYDN